MFPFCAHIVPGKKSKFLTLRVTPPAHPEPALAPKWPKMAPSWHPIGFKNRPKMGYPIGLGAQKWGTPSALGPTIQKNRFKKATQQKRGRLPTASPLLSRKSGQHGHKLSSKIDQKSIKNLCKYQSFFWCLLGSIYARNLADFWSQKEAKLRPIWHRKSMWT